MLEFREAKLLSQLCKTEIGRKFSTLKLVLLTLTLSEKKLDRIKTGHKNLN